MEKICEACGMPLMEKEDFAGGNENGKFCLHCADAEGNVKPCEEIFEGGVQFFLEQFGGERAMAEKITRKNMSRLPHWQGSDCSALKGEMATDEEFAALMSKL